MLVWYVVGSLGLALLMVVHESGHFFAARAYGMRVTRFSIGFGPTFFKIEPGGGYYWFTTLGGKIRIRLHKHGTTVKLADGAVQKEDVPTTYQVAMIPFLAYVQIAGMNPLEEIDPGDKGSYANAPLLGRILTIFGGPFANYIFASVFFFVSFFFGGRLFRPTVVNALENRPAAAAGVKSGDKIVAIAGVEVREWEQMAELISQHPGDPIDVEVERAGERVKLTITPENDHGRGKIGVAGVVQTRVPVGGVEALTLAVTKPPEVVRDLAVGLSQFITGKGEGDLVGPAGIVKETAKAAKNSWTDLFYVLGALSAYLGAFNLIPFPALDGGRLMFLAYEATTRRRPNARIEAHIHAIGLVMMISLMLYVTVAKDFGFGSK